MNVHRLAQIAKDEDFRQLLDAIGDDLTRKVMAPATSAEDRIEHLAEYHALQRIKARLAGAMNEAQGEETDA